MVDRYGVGERSAAAIATSTSQSTGFIFPEERHNVIDRYKIRRCCDKMRKKLNSQQCNEFIGLYFDSRKDLTLSTEKDAEGIIQKSCRKEEHVSLIEEPGNKFLKFVTPSSGCAPEILSSILEVVKNDFIAIGCDGTAVNTGVHAGVIRLYEQHLKHELQWIICLLHFTELPLRALFIDVDGQTTQPNAFSGEIGKTLPNSVNLTIVKFKKILTTLPQLKHGMKVSDLSTEQRYMYEMSEAISIGFVSPRLAKLKPGKINHSRWITLANNVLRTYVGTTKPSSNLIVLVTFIQRVYAPSWFHIKINNKCIDGAKNLWYFIQASRYLQRKYRIIVDQAIQRNAYFAHPENILLAMIHDEKKEIRQLAYQRIVHARTNKNQDDIRRFKIPLINFKARTYCELIDWDTTYITEPPLIKHFTELELEVLVNGGDKSDLWNFNGFDIPNHTQAVERCIKLVTETAIKITGHERQNGLVKSTIKSRNIMPTFNTKKDFPLQ